MKRIKIKHWNNNFSAKQIRSIRREIIKTSINECVFVDFEGVVGLSTADLEFLIEELPRLRVKFGGLPLEEET